MRPWLPRTSLVGNSGALRSGRWRGLTDRFHRLLVGSLSARFALSQFTGQMFLVTTTASGNDVVMSSSVFRSAVIRGLPSRPQWHRSHSDWIVKVLVSVLQLFLSFALFSCGSNACRGWLWTSASRCSTTSSALPPVLTLSSASWAGSLTLSSPASLVLAIFFVHLWPIIYYKFTLYLLTCGLTESSHFA